MRENFLEPFLQKLVQNNNDTLKTPFAGIAEDIKNRIDKQLPDRRDNIPWTGSLISSIMLLLVRDGRLEPAWSVLANYMGNQHGLVGFPSVEAINGVMDALIAGKDAAKIKMCLKLASELGFVEVTDRTEEMTQALELPKLETQQWMRLYTAVDYNDPFRNVKKGEAVAV